MIRVLGPCPCQRCRVPLWWNGWEWQDTLGYRHTCRAGIARRRRR